MRTFSLFAALLLLAFQPQAQTLQETADQVPAQDQPRVKDQDQPGAEDQDLLGDEDQDMAISFTGEERFTRQLPGFDIPKIIRHFITRSCHCRPSHECPGTKLNKVLRHLSWTCGIFRRRRRNKFCCK